MVDTVGLVITQRDVILRGHYAADGQLILVGTFGAALMDATTEKMSPPVGNPKLLHGDVKVHFSIGSDAIYATASGPAGTQVWKVTAPAKKKP